MKNSQKGFLIPLLSVIIVILLIITAYFYVQNKNVKNLEQDKKYVNIDKQVVGVVDKDTLPVIVFSGRSSGDFNTPGIWKAKDSKTYVQWVINYKNAKYYETWNTGTTTLSRLGDINKWLQENKANQECEDYKLDVSCGVGGGNATIGTVDTVTGILNATMIFQHVQ